VEQESKQQDLLFQVFWPNGVNLTTVEEYDGSTWTGGGAIPTANAFDGINRNSNSCYSFWWLSQQVIQM
jgi:hypothetical protein